MKEVKLSELIAFLQFTMSRVGDMPVICERECGYDIPYTDGELHTDPDGNKSLII